MNNNKWIVVTGATGGLGENIAKRLLETGYRVVASGRNEEKLEALFGGYGDRALRLPWDMSDPETTAGFADLVFEKAGAVDGLVISAGVSKILPVTMLKKAIIDEVFSINAYAPIMLTGAFLKRGRMNPGGSIILLSSLSAHEGAKGLSLYAASKGALEAFAQAVSAELAQKGIRINCIAPGMLLTQMTEGFLSNLDGGQAKQLEDGYPLGFGRPENVTGLVEYLLGDEGKWVTGQTFLLGGGRFSRA